MKTIIRAYKFRIYPKRDQKVLLSQHFGCSRFIYNYFLDLRNKNYLSEKKNTSYYECSNILTSLKKDENYIWLKQVNAQALQMALRHLDSAYASFFQKKTKFPKFKKKSNRQSFCVPQSFSLEDNKLYLPKFKTGIDINIHQKIKGNIKHVTISMTPTDKYFASLTCEQEYATYEPTGSQIGIDVGVKDLAILSNGKKYKNNKVLKQYLSKLKYKQRQLSKKVKGSSGRSRQRVQVARVHEKIANIRRDTLHKITTDIIKNHDVICVETLAVINMMKNHKLAQALSNAAIGEFFSMLEYKANWNDKTIIKIDRWYPSSKNCSVCNTINQGLTLKDRVWTCRACGATHDRDINAANNILTQGLKILNSGLGTKSESKQKQVEPPKKYSLRSQSGPKGPKGQHGEKGAMKPEAPSL